MFGENLRVLEWIISRCKNEMEAVETPIGYLPHENDIDMTSLRIPRENIKKLLAINKNDWIQEAESVKEFLSGFGKNLPPAIRQEYQNLKKRLAK